jgi:hypothetical protein
MATAMFSYIHIFSYQDFVDYKPGDVLTGDFIPSNDDGTHGSNDRWGDSLEHTWPDVPGDTNIYINYTKPMMIEEKDGENVLHLDVSKGQKQIIGSKDVPAPGDHVLKMYFDFYLDTKSTPDQTVVFFSTDDPDVIGRMAVIYEDGYFKGLLRTGRYSVKEMFKQKVKNLENRWNQFDLEIWYYREIRIKLNSKLIYKWEFDKRLIGLPHYYVGNLVDKNQTSNLDLYLKNFIVSHYK